VKPIRGGLLLTVGALALLLPATSWATYPGANGLIAYVGSEHSSRESRYEIFTIPPAGGEPTQLTHNHLLDYNPTWSADGRRIAFVRWQPGKVKGDVWTMRADGRHQHLITRPGATPHFSPGGGQIVLALRHSIATVGIDGAGLRRLVFGRVVGSPKFSPDGRRIAFSWIPKHTNARESIWTMRRDGSHLRRLTRPPEEYGSDEAPDWRPDGRRIIFRHSVCNERGCEQAIHSVRPDGSRERSIDARGSFPGVYSPTGNRIALHFTEWDSIFQNLRCADVFTTKVAGHLDVREVTHNCDPHNTRFRGLAFLPSWQPISRP
jgi:Tol biopolymer transport system component